MLPQFGVGLSVVESWYPSIYDCDKVKDGSIASKSEDRVGKGSGIYRKVSFPTTVQRTHLQVGKAYSPDQRIVFNQILSEAKSARLLQVVP